MTAFVWWWPRLLRVSPDIQGLCRPHELLQRTREERPPPHGHPCFRQSLQGQKTMHYIVVNATLAFYVCWIFFFFFVAFSCLVFILSVGRSEWVKLWVQFNNHFVGDISALIMKCCDSALFCLNHGSLTPSSRLSSDHYVTLAAWGTSGKHFLTVVIVLLFLFFCFVFVPWYFNSSSSPRCDCHHSPGLASCP